MGTQNKKQLQTDFWSVAVVLCALLLLAPLIAVFIGVFQPTEEWQHLASTVLPGYLLNTLILILGVGLVSVLFAVPTAWFVATYEFPTRRFWKWALVMPLAVPTFASAFAYLDVLELSIPLIVKVREVWGFDASQWIERLVRYGMLILLLSSVLYPYLYLSLRSTFSKQQGVYFEAGRMLGKRPASIFRRIALPMARPTLIAGLSLVVMEVVNEYGAVNLFGVPTLTEGIFRTWFGLGDRASGLRLAVIVVVLVFAVLAFEVWQRRRLRYVEGAQSNIAHRRVRLCWRRAWLIVVLCALPVLIGFIFPVLRLIYWAIVATDTFDFVGFLSQAGSSLGLALMTALSLSIVAFFLAFSVRVRGDSSVGKLVQSATLGYAIPSVVTAVGVMVLLGSIDQLFADSSLSLVLSGSLFAIGFAYMVRFMTVAYQPLNGSMQAVCSTLHEASRTLGQGNWQSLTRIHWPLLRINILACATLVFIDIMKELPLTLVLRPSDFETLATFAFGFAKEGYIYDCALPSLLIILLGVWGLLVIERWVDKDATQSC
ncbi:MAG: iron ABC transporter permease [Opitutae bacterium]|nr:iron ABC transporter permease [Opitutae bacterium]MDG1300890.1 iron ABC transporter permease [Opitutae bacterium]